MSSKNKEPYMIELKINELNSIISEHFGCCSGVELFVSMKKGGRRQVCAVEHENNLTLHVRVDESKQELIKEKTNE